MTRRRQVYEGKAKVLFEGPEPGTLVQYFKDDATAFNNKKKGTITGKGVLNNRISEYLMIRLGEVGIPTHFVRRLNMREQLIKEVEIIPLEVVVRNVAAGSLATRLGVAEGTMLPRSIVEFYYKNDELGDPMVSEEHITCFGWANPQEIDEIMHLALRINDFLSGLFLGIGIRLVDFKLEFGRWWQNDEMRIILADEPTGALDTETGNLVVDVLRATTERGCALVLVTHDPDHAARMGRVLRLRDGVLHPETVPALSGAPTGPVGALPDRGGGLTHAPRHARPAESEEVRA